MSTPTAINCPSCGAGQSVLGGGRVACFVCDYCGALLDSFNDFALIKKLTQNPHPELTPFEIGMSGEIAGISYDVIGTLVLRDSSARWVEHQIFSATHGYAWLVVEKGHVTLSRRIRYRIDSADFPTHPLSLAAIEHREYPPGLYVFDEHWHYFASDHKEIEHAEGAFSYIPKQGDRSEYMEFLNKNGVMLSLEQSENETELYRSEYPLQKPLLQSFGAKLKRLPVKIHPLDYHPAGPWSPALSNLSLIAFFASICMSMFSSGDNLGSARGSVDQPAKLEIEVTNAQQNLALVLNANFSNYWYGFDILITNAVGTEVSFIPASLAQYSGVEDGETWHEGSTITRLVFSVPNSGLYTIQAKVENGEVWRDGSRPRELSQFSITADENIRHNWPWVIVSIASAFGILFSSAKAVFRNFARANDWEE